ncbi:MAG TPA: hypothetical protein VGM52_00715 [Herbaspirillum sp.]|jgi:hypothetical protein
MSQQAKQAPESSAAARKKKLLADGALHRANIVMARADIAAGTQPGALTKEALSQLAESAKGLLFNSVREFVAHPGKLSPLLLTGFSLLSKSTIRKPLMYVGVAGGAVAGAIYLFKLFCDKDKNQNGDYDRPINQ